MNQSLKNSFKHAFDGLRYCIRSERNFRIHLICTLYVFFFSAFYNFSKGEYMLLILLCASVIAAEMMNTAIERIVNLQAKNFDLLAKAAKDIASGAVFVLAISAVVTGGILFYDIEIIREIVAFFFSNILYLLLLVLSVILSFIFIFKKR